MFDNYEMQQIEEARAELRKIKTPKDFYRIVNAVYDKYGSDIGNKARELENAWCY
jgi:hypothetical protein|nr:MAG TPA: hypothetical protein [Caudoviricetes sp.]